MFRRGFYCGMLVGIVATVGVGYFTVRTVAWIGGEQIAEFGARMHAAERRYSIQASPVLGDFTEEDLSEPTPAQVRAMRTKRTQKGS